MRLKQIALLVCFLAAQAGLAAPSPEVVGNAYRADNYILRSTEAL